MLAVFLLAFLTLCDGELSSDELLAQTREALSKGQPEEALELVDRAIAADSKLPEPYVLRASICEEIGDHEGAVAAYGQAIELGAESSSNFDSRGSELFKLGKNSEALRDFDRAIELEPRLAPGHWKRGISLYYAGKFDEGRKQFEGYQTVDDNDVENAVWRYLCMAKGDGLDKARREILKIGRDTRVPMMQVYDLYKGASKPDDVLAAAKAGEPSEAELNQRLFYAHLYLGLYFDAAGDAALAKEHLQTSVEHKIGHYMWDVARVHRDLLDAEPAPAPGE